jgi:hypothetical protein
VDYPSNFNFPFGCVCYRDPIEDGILSEAFGFDPDEETLQNWVYAIEPKGGSHLAKGWADGFRLLCNLLWRPDALRCVFWIADAPAHGRRFCNLAPTFDRHPELESLLEPWVQKVAKLNVVFVGLALGVALFSQIRVIYTLAGGPSFAIEEFHPDKSDEVERIAAFLQEQSLELVN